MTPFCVVIPMIMNSRSCVPLLVTDVHHLRHSKFIALRDDKKAKDVKREF
jgi:hypothetical protein